MKNKIQNLLFCCCLLFLAGQINAQPNCDIGSTNSCGSTHTLNISPGENISFKLQAAIYNNCSIRIPNNGGTNVTYLIDPMVFSGDDLFPNTSIENKRIILEPGVTLESIFGGFNTNCSQSVFTFDGSGNKNISIWGLYDSCLNRPTIKMPSVNYHPVSTTGFLVASDNVGQPYLNNAGDPNFVFADNVGDPYFDNNGNPNLITGANSTQPPVPADCDFNFNLCNQSIIVWCPQSWEGNHVIAIHGAQNMTIRGINIESSAGGDGIVIAGAEDEEPASNILINDVIFTNNARTGVNIVDATCIQVRNSIITETGMQPNVTNFVDVKGGLALQPNPITDYNLEYFMHSIDVRNSQLVDNTATGITVDFPSLLSTTFTPPVDVRMLNICLDDSPSLLVFDGSLPTLDGNILMRNFTFANADIGIEVTNNWESQQLSRNFRNFTLSNPSVFVDIDNSSNTFCDNLVIADICLGNSTTFCGLNNNCNTNNNFFCTPLEECPDDNSCMDPYFNLTVSDVLNCDNPTVTISTNSDGFCYAWDHDTSETGPTVEVSTGGTYCVTVTECGTDCSVVECIEVVDEDCGDCGPVGCTCELTFTLVNLGNPFEEVALVSPTATPGNIGSWDEAGTFSVTIDAIDGCDPHRYIFALGGNATNVEVEITVSGCGFDDDVFILAPGGVFVELEVEEPCLPPPPNPECETIDGETLLTWDEVPGAESYNLIINEGDGTCCTPGLVTTTVTNITDLEFSGPLPACYSWQVQTVNENDILGDPSDPICSSECGDDLPCIPPVIDLSFEEFPNCDLPFTLVTTNTTGFCYAWDHDPLETGSEIFVGEGTYCVTVTECGDDCETVECIEVVGDFDDGEGCGDCGPVGCTCELTITLVNLGNDFDQLSFINLGVAIIETWDQPGTYTVTASSTDGCNPEDYAFTLGGNATNVEVEITISGCGIESETFILTFFSNPIIFDLDEPCLPPPPNPQCVSSENGNALTWDSVSGSTGYQVTINAGPSDCCPGNLPTEPITATVTGNQFILPSSLPDCFTYQVSTINQNGIISSPSDRECFEEDCEEVDPDPCGELEQPDPTCEQVEGETFVSWSADPNASGYIVTLTFGGGCCEEATQPRTFIYQVTDNQVTLPVGYGDCYSISVEAYCPDFTSSEPSVTICFDRNGCQDSDGGGRTRSDEFNQKTSLASDLNIYPNPTSDLINIQIETVLENSLNLSLIGPDGRIIKNSVYDLDAGQNLIHMGTETMENGIYFLQLETGQEKYYRKIIIMK